MIEEVLNQWVQDLMSCEVTLSGTHSGICTECLDAGLRSAAGIVETDPHVAVHPLIVELKQFAREYDEDASETLDFDGPLGLQVVISELLVVDNGFIRRALDAYIVPVVDALVAEMTKSVHVLESE